MIIESHRAEFMANVGMRIGAAADDAVDLARQNLGGHGALTASVTVMRLGPGHWVLGSNHPGAFAQERGAYIRPRRRDALKFNGRYSMHARIPAKKWLSKSGRQWRTLVTRSLRSEGSGSSALRGRSLWSRPRRRGGR